MSLPPPASFRLEQDYDMVVVGSGGASMCAALVAREAGLNVAILEKQAVVGGSTGFSGGVWWVPNNAVMKRAGVQDSAERARAYLDAVVGDASRGASPERRRAFIEQAPEMIDFLERSGMTFYYADGWSDYYDERPGGEPRGRSLLAKRFNINRLGEWADKLSIYEPARELPIGSDEMLKIFMMKRSWASKRKLLKLVTLMAANKLFRWRYVASGGSLQGRMLEMALKRSIPIFTDCAVDRFIEEDGRVVGVGGSRNGEPFEVRARRGVLLNTGGFARNDTMRQKYQRAPISGSWTNANYGETGEMLEAAIALGAAVENLDAAWWVITSLNPDGSMPAGATGKDGKAYPFMHNAELAAPHLIIVDRDGRRYMNEANSYVEVGETMYRHDAGTGRAIPSFAVFDSRHMKRYFWGSAMPGTKPLKRWLESGFLKQADTIEAAAESAGIDPAGLKATVERFNLFAVRGIDEDFQRGARVYDRSRGDPTVRPNPNLGTIAEGPFYVIQLYPADVGTQGGVVTDERARVLRDDGSVIEGLYAAGNCTSSVFGRAYPGAGASIAASFAFGYVAAKDMVGKGVGAPI